LLIRAEQSKPVFVPTIPSSTGSEVFVISGDEAIFVGTGATGSVSEVAHPVSINGQIARAMNPCVIFGQIDSPIT
jgi:glucose/arabinose dehydrogenase